MTRRRSSIGAVRHSLSYQRRRLLRRLLRRSCAVAPPNRLRIVRISLCSHGKRVICAGGEDDSYGDGTEIRYVVFVHFSLVGAFWCVEREFHGELEFGIRRMRRTGDARTIRYVPGRFLLLQGFGFRLRPCHLQVCREAFDGMSSRSHDPHPRIPKLEKKKTSAGAAFAQLHLPWYPSANARGHFAKEWGAASSLRG